MSTEIKQLIAKIHTQLGISEAEGRSSLSHDELDRLRQSMPFASAEFFDWLQVCNPQVRDLFPYFESIDPTTYANRIVAEVGWRNASDGMFVGGFVGWTSSTNDACRLDLSWRDFWIPIGEFNGDLTFIDCDPSDHGTHGQVVETSNDGRFLRVIGHSIEHWLTRLCAAIDSPEQHPDYKEVCLGPVASATR